MFFEQGNSERRAATRFPIEREVQYKLLAGNGLNMEGIGRTLNISSSGILFSVDRQLQTGTNIEVTISWPMALDGDAGLWLVAVGRVVRAAQKTAAVRMHRHEFRSMRYAEI